MMQTLSRCLTLVLLLMVPLATPSVWAQAPPEDLPLYLNRRVKEVAASRMNQRSNTNQTEAPSMSGNSTSLVDQSSVSDLIGVALNLAELSGASVNDQETTSASVTVTAYAFYAGLKGIDSLDPATYSAKRNWRRLSLTLGYDNEKDTESGSSSDRATIVGIKYLVWNRRDGTHPCYWNDKLKCYNNAMDILQKSLEKATGKFSGLFAAVDAYLYDRVGKNMEFKDLAKGSQDHRAKFRDDYLSDGPRFQSVLAMLGSDEVKKLDKFIEDKIQPFQDLEESAVRAVETVRRAPQLSLSMLSKRRKEGADEYMAELIFDYGIHPRINWTGNAAFEFKDNKIIKDERGGKFATQLAMQLTQENRLAGRKPLSFSLAADGKWMTGIAPTYKGQAKFTIPILDGIDFPVSFTFASRTDLVNEKEVRGQFGFTFDVSRLLAIGK